MRVHKLLITIGMAIAIAVSGCAQTGETKRKQYAVQGCAVGGLGAGLVTFITNIDDEDAKEKAVIAGMLGCMAGAVVGYQIGKRTEEYADAQDAARSEIARNEEQIDGLRQYNAQLAVNIEDYRKQISTIKDSHLTEHERMKNLNDTKEIVAKQRGKATESLRDVERELYEAKEQYAKYQAETPLQDKDRWQTEIASLEQEKEILSGHVNTLNALDASI